jgi:hypothetical protein
VRPCFVVDSALQVELTRYKGKEEITPAGSQKSIFQKGFSMIYCNPVPISAACLVSKDVVQSTLTAILKAINDLVQAGKQHFYHIGYSINL